MIITIDIPKDASAEEISMKLSKAIFEALDESEKEEEIDVCEGCAKAESCSDERKANHRKKFRAFQNFKDALENVLEAMYERADQNDFAKILDDLSEKSKALSDVLKSKN